jgi:hypothetical protein
VESGALNPFSTRFVRPGALEYLFAEGESGEGVVGRLSENGWWGQIVGPHGSGKSTLLAALIPHLEAAGRRVISMTLHQGEHRLPSLGVELNSSTQLVIDGYEQLGWFSRRRAKSRCRGAGCGLLVTTHRDMGLATVFETRPSEEVASAVVAKLLPGGQAEIGEAEIKAAYAAAGGNIREALFRLFDMYEERGRRLEVEDRTSEVGSH